MPRAVTSTATKPRSFLLAGGGSGGHISPGLAIAERLAERDPDVRAVFVCSHRPVDARMLGAAGATYVPLTAAPLSLRPRGAMAFLGAFQRGRREAEAIIDEHGVDEVLALGGFVAGPVVAAATGRRVPVTLLNLDDPPGRANRWMARRATRTWSAVALPRHRRFASRVTGLPVRRCAIAAGSPASCRETLGLRPDLSTLLVTGASQGAGTINALLPALAEARTDDFRGWQVLHLAGAGADEEVRERYRAAGVPALVLPFTDSMGAAWGAADLAVSRAGANSVAEIAANAVPALLLPYPFHRDQHQRNNARPLEEAGGAVIVDDRVDTEANLAEAGAAIAALMGDAARRAEMRQRLSAQRPEDAADAIAASLLETAGRPREAAAAREMSIARSGAR
jgi:UDP-N-acetylglucosamine--N-acetylmuramyl-(pentapeptide) pyrophosphoryl-undecaprenol N-acetylglucosamine transferase